MRFIANYRTIHRTADRHATPLSRTIEHTIARVLARTSMDALARAVGSGDQNAVWAVIDRDGRLSRAMRRAIAGRIRRTMVDAARGAAALAVR